MRDTSLLAYKDLIENGEIQKRELPIYDLLASHPKGLTNSEIAVKLKVPVNEITGRTNRMVKNGLLLDGGKRRNKRTNKLNHFWLVTGLQNQLELL